MKWEIRPVPRHCEPTGRREAPPDDRLREAIQTGREARKDWIASELTLLAMTAGEVAECQGV